VITTILCVQFQLGGGGRPLQWRAKGNGLVVLLVNVVDMRQGSHRARDAFMDAIAVSHKAIVPLFFSLPGLWRLPCVHCGQHNTLCCVMSDAFEGRRACGILHPVRRARGIEPALFEIGAGRIARPHITIFHQRAMPRMPMLRLWVGGGHEIDSVPR